jgi:hypothetical protein
MVKRKTKPSLAQLRKMHGAGFFGDIWGGIKKVANFIKDKKILSTLASVVPLPGASGASKVLGVAGLGRQRKKQAGGRMLLGPGYVNASVLKSLVPTLSGGRRGKKRVIMI